MEDSWCVGDPEEAASRLRFSCFSAFVLPGSPLPRDALTLPENLEPVPKPVPQQWVPLAAGPVDRASRVLVERFTASDATHGCQSFDQLLVVESRRPRDDDAAAEDLVREIAERGKPVR
jgi:hypothetical protein